MWYLSLGVLRHVFGVRYAVSVLFSMNLTLPLVVKMSNVSTSTVADGGGGPAGQVWGFTKHPLPPMAPHQTCDGTSWGDTPWTDAPPPLQLPPALRLATAVHKTMPVV